MKNPTDPAAADQPDMSAAVSVTNPPIRRALISVTDKTGVVDFARALQDEFAVQIVSTGGTARALTEGGVKVRAISDLTGFPEMMDGRVKTLHPKVHGGILARRDDSEHLDQAAQQGIGLIDLVVVNLYAFADTVARPDVSYTQAIENIDIGGPALLRSAAKNHAAVTVICNPLAYDSVLQEMRMSAGATSFATRQMLATAVFAATSAYDNAIYNWLYQQLAFSTDTAAPDLAVRDLAGLLSCAERLQPFMVDKRLFLRKAQDLRYGENPHQTAAFYRFQSHEDAVGPADFGVINPSWQLSAARQLQGKQLSYNNYLDLDAAWAAVREFSQPSCVIVKHLTPCGIACDADLSVAYENAFACDPVSAFGGVMAFNRPLVPSVVQAIYANEQFIEALIAPDVEPAALALLSEKPNVRVLSSGGLNPPGNVIEYRSIDGGLLAMIADRACESAEDFQVASQRPPSDAELESLLFAWKACKSVKSNAIVIARGKATVGIGAGQPNRVNSADLAVRQAGAKAQGAVAASDAFMPFADSLEVLANAGVAAVIQPGGSIRDQEVLTAANDADMAVVFTGRRHFRH